MKKLIIITLLAMCALAGCGNNNEKEGVTNNIDKSKTTKPETTTEAESGYIDGFEKADYEKFNSYASSDDLEGTKICIQGTVTETFNKKDTIGFIIKQNDNNKWTVFVGRRPLLGETKLKALLDNEIEVFGEYSGYSGMPSIDISGSDNEYYIITNEKEKILQSDFYSDIKELRKWYKSNSKEMLLSDCKRKKNRSSFRTSTGVIVDIHSTDEGYSIEFIQKSNSKYSVQFATVSDMILCEVDVLEEIKTGDGLKSYYYVDEDGEPNLLATEKVKVGFKLSDYRKSIKQDYKAKCKEYTYEKMARNPKKVKGKFVKLTGEVIQVLEYDDSVELRVNITKSEYGYYSDTVYVYYSLESKDSDRILEDDIITIYGELDGIETYTSVLGSEVTLPKINAEYIDLNKK